MVSRLSRIKVSNGQIFWREAGKDGCPVAILLHGSWHDSTQWQEILAALSKDCHCFAPDLLGFGNSIPDRLPTSIANEVECLDEFIDTLKLARPFYLIGHSLGGWIAMSYALKYPDRVRGVVLIAPEGLSAPTQTPANGFSRFLLGQPLLFKGWLSALKLLTSISDGAATLKSQQANWEFFAKFPTTCQLLFRRSTKAIQAELVADRLADFATPTLILQPESDPAGTIAQSQAYAQAVITAEYRSLPQPDPNLPDRDEAAIASIREFISSIQ